MADDEKPAGERPRNLKEEKDQGDSKATSTRQLLIEISAVIRSFSDSIIHFADKCDADQKAERHSYETDELHWTKIAARAGIGFSIVSLLLSGLTLAVLYRTYGVYQGQATIMAMQAATGKEANQIAAISLAPRVIVSASWPKPEDNISFVFTNIGNSSAYNLVIAANTIWRVPEADFDPFKSFGGTKLQSQAVEELLPGATAGSDYVVSRPSTGENLYVYGTYSYDSRVPEVPKANIRFCYVARSGGVVEPCRAFHVLSMHATIGLRSPPQLSGSATIRDKKGRIVQVVPFGGRVATPIPTAHRKE
jgi:hypothetical protein